MRHWPPRPSRPSRSDRATQLSSPSDRTRVCSGDVTTPGVSGRTSGERDDVREQLVAWAEDCRLEGEVDLDDGRLSDVVNDIDILVFSAATVVALDDGHSVKLDELEVARRDLSLIEVAGRRGDPQRRLRTIPEHVRLEVGPFTVTGNLHRPPSAHPLNALNRWSRFLPVTEAYVEIDGSTSEPATHEVVLVNRDRIHTYHVLLDAAPIWVPSPPDADLQPDAAQPLA